MKYVYVLAWLAVVVGFVFRYAKVLFVPRAKDMRALASRWGFQYIGPPASRWFSPSSLKVSPPLPASFSLACYPADETKQVGNVIKGQQSGVPILIFDSIIGEGKGAYCTFIACQNEQNPFGTDISPDHLVQSGGWTALYRLRFLQITWTIGIQRIENHLNKLRVWLGLRA